MRVEQVDMGHGRSVGLTASVTPATPYLWIYYSEPNGGLVVDMPVPSGKQSAAVKAHPWWSLLLPGSQFLEPSVT